MIAVHKSEGVRLIAVCERTNRDEVEVDQQANVYSIWH